MRNTFGCTIPVIKISIQPDPFTYVTNPLPLQNGQETSTSTEGRKWEVWWTEACSGLWPNIVLAMYSNVPFSQLKVIFSPTTRPSHCMNWWLIKPHRRHHDDNPLKQINLIEPVPLPFLIRICIGAVVCVLNNVFGSIVRRYPAYHGKKCWWLFRISHPKSGVILFHFRTFRNLITHTPRRSSILLNHHKRMSFRFYGYLQLTTSIFRLLIYPQVPQFLILLWLNIWQPYPYIRLPFCPKADCFLCGKAVSDISAWILPFLPKSIDLLYCSVVTHRS